MSARLFQVVREADITGVSGTGVVADGVCVRAEGVIPTILKAKSPQFFEFETKLLDEGVEILS